MWMSLLTVAVFSAVGGFVYFTAHFSVTRRVAAVALGVAAVELMLFNVLDVAAFPVLTLVLTALRLAVLVCCVGALRADRRAARRCAARRDSFGRRMHCVEHPLRVVSSAACTTAHCA